MRNWGRLVAGIAHGLNNPISFVYCNIHALASYRERLGRFLSAVQAGRVVGGSAPTHGLSGSCCLRTA